jgi:hypothetical protein
MDALKADDVHMKNDFSQDIFSRVKVAKDDVKSRKSSFHLIKAIKEGESSAISGITDRGALLKF